jgi:hypothetical protein
MTMGAESIQNAIAAMVQDWLNDHPLLAWCATHPVWAIALLFLFIFSAWGLLGAIAQLVKTLWIALLRAPLTLGRWIGVRLIKLFKHIPQKMPQPSDPLNTQLLQLQEIYPPSSTLNEPELTARNNSQSSQLNEVVGRLEQLQREQTQLLQEVRAMLQQPSEVNLSPHVPTLKESKPQKNYPDLSL